MAVPAFAIVMYQVVISARNWKFYLQAIFLALVYICGNLKILLGEFNRYYEHYKILTYGSLVLLVLLIVMHDRNRLPAEALNTANILNN
jgi:hypothetical protein